MLRSCSRLWRRRLPRRDLADLDFVHRNASSQTDTRHIPLHVLNLQGSELSIYERLLLEEWLLHADPECRNWMIVGNHAPSHDRSSILSPETKSCAIVMGIGGKPSELLHLDNVRRDKVLTIKRFSGGGTVVLDQNSIWTTIIGRPESFQDIVSPYPRPLMDFTANHVFEPLFSELSLLNSRQNTPQVRKPAKHETKADGSSVGAHRVKPYPQDVFELKENDFVLGEHKMGGNAQSITSTGWLHHTSFLWDYEDENMLSYLKFPKSRPDYRKDRPHADFLVRLSQHFPHLEKTAFATQLIYVLTTSFECHIANTKTVVELMDKEVGGFQGWMETRSRCKLLSV